MADTLAEVLRDIVQGLKDPSFEEVAHIAQDLLSKQVKASWAGKEGPNREAWPPLKGESFAGWSRKSGRRSPRAHLDMAAEHDISEGTVSETGFETRGQLPRYWRYQHFGTTSTGWGDGIQPREYWAFGDDMLDLVAALLAEKAAKQITEG